MLYPFDLRQSFSDPHQLVKNDKGEEVPYGLYRYDELVRECYFISSSINTSYTDLLDITPKEKNLLIRYINEKNKAEQEAIEKARKKNKK